MRLLILFIATRTPPRSMKAACCFLLSSLIVTADPAYPLKLALATAQEESGAPGMTGAIFNHEEILAQTHLGRRRADKTKKVEADDLWHIGSDGKAMTATLVARLVEKKKLSWETTMAEAFGTSAGKLHPQARGITIRQLLSHTAGLDANPSMALRLAGEKAGARQIRKQRLEVAKEALEKAPVHEPGTKYLYSNTGYILAGAVIESVLGMPWEKAIEKEVFSPLGIKSAGFGAPDGASQPRGHRLGRNGEREPLDDGYAGDNPAIYGPAGGIHLSLTDWIIFLQDQMLGHQGEGKLLKKETYRLLHQPVLNHYAMGWMVDEKERVLQHDGSNTYWHATTTLHLKEGIGTVAIANDAGPETGQALRRAMSGVWRAPSNR